MSNKSTAAVATMGIDIGTAGNTRLKPVARGSHGHRLPRCRLLPTPGREGSALSVSRITRAARALLPHAALIYRGVPGKCSPPKRSANVVAPSGLGTLATGVGPRLRRARYALQQSAFTRSCFFQGRLPICNQSFYQVMSRFSVLLALFLFGVVYQRLNDRSGLLVDQVQHAIYSLYYVARHACTALAQSVANV